MWRLAGAFAFLLQPAWADDITSASYGAPSDRYAHGVLGDAIEWGTLELKSAAGPTYKIVLPQTRVFEDTEPRLVDIDADGDREVIVVETDVNLGARLSIYDTDGLVAANDFIGQSNRWLAPVGIGGADIDGDGEFEFAYVDRPHLLKTLRILRNDGQDLKVVASLPGVTNHRIGERDIAGGVRDCGEGPEIIVATANWSHVLAVTFDGQKFHTRELAPHDGRATFADAMNCRN